MFGLFSRSSLDDLLADAERALAGGDAKRAFKIASKALSSAGRNFGRAADAAVVAAEAAERAGTGQVQMFAGLALTLMDDQSKLRERGIALDALAGPVAQGAATGLGLPTPPARG